MELSADGAEADNLLLLEQQEGIVHSRFLGEGQVVYYSNISPAASINQDGLLIAPAAEQGLVLAVADGMGGSRCGHEAAKLALHCLEHSVRENSIEGLRGAILDGFELANKTILSEAPGSATTLVVVEVREGYFRSFHVGDSFSLLCGQRGKLKYLTTDHSPVGYGVESGLLKEEEGFVHDERHVITNYLGFDEMSIELGPKVRMSQRDTLLLATDGLSDNLLTTEILERVRKGSLSSCANNLVSSCEARMMGKQNGHTGKPDDLSFILFRLGH